MVNTVQEFLEYLFMWGSLIFIQVFSMISVQTKTRLDYDKEYRLKQQLKKVFNKAHIDDIEC